MGCEQAGIKKHLTEDAKECCKIKPKVTGNSGEKLGFITQSPRGLI